MLETNFFNLKMNEEEQKILEYEAQLSQVNLAISHLQEGPEKADLISLKNDLLELLSLSKIYCAKQSNQPSTNLLEDEYNKFKVELQKLNTQNEKDSMKFIFGKSKINEFFLKEELNSLEGKKCSAPFFCKWANNTTYHNAFISKVPETVGINNFKDIKVKVMFLNPIHKEMLPCNHYLNGTCKYKDSECKYSHGELVLLSSLKEYREPIFSNIRIGSRVLAKRDDELWYGAQILEVNDNDCNVKFELNLKEVCIPLHNIFLLDSESYLGGETSNNVDEKKNYDFDVTLQSKDSEEIIRGIFNNSCTAALGEWEKFTKGFGSKIMAKLGYIHGSGLGKDGSGRVEPIEAFVFPAGKSLDHCMTLKEKTGQHKNLLKTQKKIKHLKKKQEEKMKKAYENKKKKTDVFTFINTKLHVNEKKDEKLKATIDVSKSLNCETTRNLNVKYMQLSEEAKKLNKEIQLLINSLSKYKPNSVMFNIIKEKIATKNNEISNLNSSQKKIEIEQIQRKDRRKLTIF